MSQRSVEHLSPSLVVMYGIISKFLNQADEPKGEISVYLIKYSLPVVTNQVFGSVSQLIQVQLHSPVSHSEVRASIKPAQEVTKVSGLQQTAFLISAQQLLRCLATNSWKWKRQNITQGKCKQNSVHIQLPAHDPQGQTSWADSKAPGKSSFFFFLINCFMYVKKKPYAC